MRLRQSRAARGFTLVEMLIAMAVLGIIIGLTLPVIDAALKFNQRLETKARMQRLASAIEQAYRQDAWTFDQSPQRAINDGTQLLWSGATRKSTWTPLVQKAGEDPVILHDAFNRPWRVFISNRLETLIDGVRIPYHVVAIVSNQGGDYAGGTSLQTLHPGTTFNPTTGVLTLGRGDVGTVIDGKKIVQDLYEITQQRLAHIAKAWDAKTRYEYQADPGRNMSKDYFGVPLASNPKKRYWGGISNTILANCGVIDPDPEWGYPLSSLNIDTELGLTGDVILDGWGRTIHALNCGTVAGLRNPNNTLPGQNNPVFSAQLGTTLPNGATIIYTIQQQL